MLIMSLGLREFINFTKQKSKLNYTILQSLLALLIICPYLLSSWIDDRQKIFIMSLSIAILTIIAFFTILNLTLRDCKTRKKRELFSPKTIFKINTLALIYLGVFPSFFIYILEFDTFGNEFLLTILLTVIASDSGAYIVGKLIGKNKIFPNTSPRKTLEGSLGGLFSAAFVFTSSYYYFTGLGLSFKSWTLYLIFLAGITIAVFAQLGDYYESLIKRYFLVKNSGTLLASHGGILDRIDSHCVGIVIAYIALVILHHLNL